MDREYIGPLGIPGQLTKVSQAEYDASVKKQQWIREQELTKDVAVGQWNPNVGKSLISGTTAVDMVNHPSHYISHPSGVECITITEHMNFCLGNAIKYLWRADGKTAPIEDLKKAVWYINREIAKREGK